MFYKVKDLEGYKIHATDGELGAVHEIYFDDHEWRIRYFVVETGPWLFGRKVLIAPESVTGVDQDGHRVVVNLTREQVKNSPDITTDAPVSRQHEASLARYYGWPEYWVPGTVPMRTGLLYPFSVPYGYVGAPAVPITPEPDDTAVDKEIEEVKDAQRESTLRSSRAVSGYHIAATDGAIGHLDDFIIDDANWFIRYLVVDTGRWLSGRKVLLAPEWIESISWDELSVIANLTRDQIRSSPEYDPKGLPSREYEHQLFDAYHRPKYWEAKPEDAQRQQDQRQSQR